ncbi:related to pyridoxamine-phosphate oxidase [Melanopsichium pennsylvanicum]|uniref:pyridoxal 5'-phosphate synthase n=2 Tax=Melanopsichium pennsylvanicum TaxID=63383 RepID=A0AAJ4XRP9_9BASI|nr:related to pyridoxamine-phosphate oxidase [Melanopsichium pennsylvanicum]
MDAQVKSTDAAKTAITSHNQYKTDGLERDQLSASPIVQFNNWFKHASENGVPEPEAMTISTVALDKTAGIARPSSRVVLLKQVDPQGFLFFSNYTSRKGKELESNPYASLAFYWKELSRSIRVCGRVEKLTSEQSKEYYDSRPLGSRIGAWASPQSSTIGSRKELEQKVKNVESKFGVPFAAGLEEGNKFQGDEKAVDVPLPDFWGGYRIVPDEVEFWCGRPNRLHDRFRYTRSLDSGVPANEDKWTIDRLAP